MKQSTRGRAAELAVSGRFLDALQNGPRGLVLAGEAGIGKTTLWKQVLAEASARSYWVLACRPTESETALSFAALADLLAEVPVDVLAGLPAPQQRGLQVALLRAEPEADVGADPAGLGGQPTVRPRDRTVGPPGRNPGERQPHAGPPPGRRHRRRAHRSPVAGGPRAAARRLGAGKPDHRAGGGSR